VIRELRAAALLLAAAGGGGPAMLRAQVAPVDTTASEASDVVREIIRQRIEDGREADAMRVAGDTLWLPPVAARFYEARGFEPAWSRDDTVSAIADSLLATLRRAGEDGLRPADYHVARAQELLEALRRSTTPEPSELADLDLLLTDGYAAFTSHLVAGRLDPVTLGPRTAESPEGLDLARRLERAVGSGGVRRSITALIDGSEPGYRRLRTALARYRSLAARGGWPRLPPSGEGQVLGRGSRDPAVAVLRHLLEETGDYAPPADEDVDAAERGALIFDAGLEVAVRRFQARHGLPETGAVGPRTRAALQIPPALRARQIELNLERWRWLPEALGRRFVLVNIAGFTVDVVDDDRTVLSMPAIVGTAYRQTPVFSDTITYVVFNPSWRVPRDIAREEIVPAVREDPGYLAREGLRLIGPDGHDIDPTTIDWNALPARLPWRFEQEPGPRNALGPVKLMFPNPYDVYLHGTPQPELFKQAVRAFSHGCIRLERPLELARYVLEGDAEWTDDRIAEVLREGREVTAPLRYPMPVYVEYWTAWGEPDGTVQFRDDIYERDRVLDRALPPAEK
jgi:murein L,D-transpeptidase YcbB/YkuD